MRKAGRSGRHNGLDPRQSASKAALLLIDVINDLDFPNNERMMEDALKAAEYIKSLKQRASEAGIPVIYVNDNFGHWRSDFREVSRIVAEETPQGRKLVDVLSPDDDDYFVLKPRHSGFHNTTLETLLRYLSTERLILTGFSTHVCILMTASDAYMREFELYVPRDCTAAPSPEEWEKALAYMEDVFDVDTRQADRLDLWALSSSRAEERESVAD